MVWILEIIDYAVVSFIGVHAFVVFHEEPTLKRKFGAMYEDYLRRVPRWIPDSNKTFLMN